MLTEQENLQHVQVLGPASIKSFVDTPHDRAALIIAGQKGSGKTLALRKRSFQYRNNKGYEGIKCIPQLQLVEKLASLLTESFDAQRLLEYRTEQAWFVIWAIALCVAIMKRVGHEIPEPLLKLLGGNAEGGIGDILQRLLTADRTQLKEAPSLVGDIVRPFIRGVREPIAIFLDSIEEAMEHHSGDPLRAYERFKDPRRGHLNQDVWFNSQIALVDVAVEFRNSSAHVKIFAAVRLEALDRYPTARVANIEQYVERVTYNREHLREIFYENIRLTRQKQLITGEELVAKIDAPTEIQMFFGTDSDDLAHVVVGQKEHIFDTLWRHTFGRPRDIIGLGREIMKQLKPHQRRDERRLAECINERAALLFKYFKKEVVPYWDDEFDPVFPLIRHNILSSAQLNQIRREFQEATQCERDPLLYLYRKGLLGIQQYSMTNDLVQVFLDGSDNNDDVELPEARYYFVHPCLGMEIRNHRTSIEALRQYSNATVIVGNGFPVPKDFALERVYLGLNSKTREPIAMIDGVRVASLDRFSKAPTILMYGLMMAFACSKQRIVSCGMVLDRIEKLHSLGLIRDKLGNKKLRPREYFGQQFDVTDKKKNDALADLRQILAKHDFGNTESVISQIGQTFELGTFSPEEIIVELKPTT